jgi:hypothetical protein
VNSEICTFDSAVAMRNILLVLHHYSNNFILSPFALSPALAGEGFTLNSREAREAR